MVLTSCSVPPSGQSSLFQKQPPSCSTNKPASLLLTCCCQEVKAATYRPSRSMAAWGITDLRKMFSGQSISLQPWDHCFTVHFLLIFDLQMQDDAARSLPRSLCFRLISLIIGTAVPINNCVLCPAATSTCNIRNVSIPLIFRICEGSIISNPVAISPFSSLGARHGC